MCGSGMSEPSEKGGTMRNRLRRLRNVRHEIGWCYEEACMWIAMHSPARLRVWFVVDATNEARKLHPDPLGYSGPDGLGYKEIYDGAMRRKA